MTDAASDRAQAIQAGRPWWETRVAVALVIFATAVPLLYPPIPPLVDLMGHMGRYRVELDLANSPSLQQYYNYHWAAIGNLGVDLLVMALRPVMGLEPAVKLIVLAIPTLTAAGFLWVAREVHGRIPPTAFFAIPFAYGHPFMFGFVNFALSMALAFLAFGLWLRLGRLGRTKLRAWLFVPISILIFFCHTYGWGVLGLLCFSAEAVRQHDRGIGWFRAGLNAAAHASVMALPILITLLWRSETHGGETTDWFNWEGKWLWTKAALRDRWRWFDIGSVVFVSALFVGLIVYEAAWKRHMTLSRNLAFSGLVLIAGFLILPRIIFGSAYADMRLVPYIFAMLLLAIRFRPEALAGLGNIIAVLALIFGAARLGANTASLAMASDDIQANLAALDHVEQGASVVTMVQLPCTSAWALPRISHIGAMVMVRREGFSNDQWVMEGLNLLELKYRKAGYFTADPSQLVRPNHCRDRLHLQIDQALARLPRQDFGYLWLIDPPPFDSRLVAGLQPVWRNGRSILYRLH